MSGGDFSLEYNGETYRMPDNQEVKRLISAMARKALADKEADVWRIWTGKEVAAGIEKWLLMRRDEIKHDDSRWGQVDDLLGEARNCFVEGLMPWQERT